MVGMTVGKNSRIQKCGGLRSDRLESEPAIPEGPGIDDDHPFGRITKDRIGESSIEPGILGHVLQTVGWTERMMLIRIGFARPQGFGQFQNSSHSNLLT